MTHACTRVSRERASRVLGPGALEEHCRLSEVVSDDVAFGRVALEERQHESTMHPRIPLSRCGGGNGGGGGGWSADQGRRPTHNYQTLEGAPDGHRARIRPVSPPWASPVPPYTGPHPSCITLRPRGGSYVRTVTSMKKNEKERERERKERKENIVIRPQPADRPGWTQVPAGPSSLRSEKSQTATRKVPTPFQTQKRWLSTPPMP